jgi:calcineurin-like phosphoesterase family protein
MNEKLIYNWNLVVRPDDKVYCLGDFSLAIRPIELFSGRLMGEKYLVPGNHDWCHSYNKKSRNGKLSDQIKKYEDCGWKVLPEKSVMEFGGIEFNVCHMPYLEDWHEKDKYERWRPKDDGKWLLHGHSHSDKSNRIKGKMIDVGVDAWDYAPVNIEEILKIVKTFN